MDEDLAVYATAAEVRQMFNESQVAERAAAGSLDVLLDRDSHPATTKWFPLCTRSQTLHYFEPAGVRVAVAHQYLLPDGSLAGSGRPDPKMVLKDGIYYKVKHRHEE